MTLHELLIQAEKDNVYHVIQHGTVIMYGTASYLLSTFHPKHLQTYNVVRTVKYEAVSSSVPYIAAYVMT